MQCATIAFHAVKMGVICTSGALRNDVGNDAIRARLSVGMRAMQARSQRRYKGYFMQRRATF
jgi:hypothetical protein